MEREPNNNIGDKNAIDLAVIGAEVFEAHITDAQARTIAAQWDAGARSDLHSFVTTGRIGEGLEAEITATFDATTDPDDQQALSYLSSYAQARADKGEVQGWNNLWIDKGPGEALEDCAACGEHFSSPHAPDCPLNTHDEEGK